MANCILEALSVLCQLLGRVFFVSAASSFITGLGYSGIATIFQREFLGMNASQISLLGAALGVGFFAIGCLFLYLSTVCINSLSGTTS